MTPEEQEHFQKYCSHLEGKKDETVFLGFGVVSAQLQGLLNLLLLRSLAKTPKILGPNGCRIFSNALARIEIDAQLRGPLNLKEITSNLM